MQFHESPDDSYSLYSYFLAVMDRHTVIQFQYLAGKEKKSKLFFVLNIYCVFLLMNDKKKI